MGDWDAPRPFGVVLPGGVGEPGLPPRPTVMPPHWLGPPPAHTPRQALPSLWPASRPCLRPPLLNGVRGSCRGAARGPPETHVVTQTSTSWALRPTSSLAQRIHLLTGGKQGPGEGHGEVPSCSRTRLAPEVCRLESVTWSHPSWSQPTWSHPSWRQPCPKKDGLLASGGSQLGGDGASQGASLSCMPTVMEAGWGPPAGGEVSELPDKQRGGKGQTAEGYFRSRMALLQAAEWMQQALQRTHWNTKEGHPEPPSQGQMASAQWDRISSPRSQELLSFLKVGQEEGHTCHWAPCPSEGLCPRGWEALRCALSLAQGKESVWRWPYKERCGQTPAPGSGLGCDEYFIPEKALTFCWMASISCTASFSS